jgi:long-subunit fatty acid transport protein
MKHFLSIIIIVFSISFIQSQTYFGFKVGGNYTGIISDIDDAKMIMASQAGLFVETQINVSFGLQGEVMYSLQGYFNDETEIRTNFKYINTNIFLKYYHRDYLTFDFGPQVGYMLDASFTTGADEIDSSSDLYKKWNFGVGLGSTYSFDDWLTVGLHYNIGFNDIIKSDAAKARNSTLQASLGYKF